MKDHHPIIQLSKKIQLAPKMVHTLTSYVRFEMVADNDNTLQEIAAFPLKLLFTPYEGLQEFQSY